MSKTKNIALKPKKEKDKRIMIKGKNDLEKRLFEFAVDVLLFLKKMPHSPENDVIRYQLTKSATSSGANYEEAQAGSS